MSWSESPTTFPAENNEQFSPDPSRKARSSVELRKELDSLIDLRSTFSAQRTLPHSQLLFEKHKEVATEKLHEDHDEEYMLINTSRHTDPGAPRDSDNKSCSELPSWSDSPKVSPRKPAKVLLPELDESAEQSMAVGAEVSGEEEQVENMVEERIQVICRVRPVQAEDGRCVAVSETDVGLMTLLAQPPISFKFDYVAGEDSSQEELFARVGRPLAQAVLRGYNATCFAYGQTSSGKVLALSSYAIAIYSCWLFEFSS